jgi:hypothetical protein
MRPAIGLMRHTVFADGARERSPRGKRPWPETQRDTDGRDEGLEFVRSYADFFPADLAGRLQRALAPELFESSSGFQAVRLVESLCLLRGLCENSSPVPISVSLVYGAVRPCLIGLPFPVTQKVSDEYAGIACET